MITNSNVGVGAPPYQQAMLGQQLSVLQSNCDTEIKFSFKF